MRLIREHYDSQISTLTRQLSDREDTDKQLNQQIATLQCQVVPSIIMPRLIFHLLQLSHAQNHESAAVKAAILNAEAQAKEVLTRDVDMDFT